MSEKTKTVNPKLDENVCDVEWESGLELLSGLGNYQTQARPKDCS